MRWGSPVFAAEKRRPGCGPRAAITARHCGVGLGQEYRWKLADVALHGDLYSPKLRNDARPSSRAFARCVLLLYSACVDYHSAVSDVR